MIVDTPYDNILLCRYLSTSFLYHSTLIVYNSTYKIDKKKNCFNIMMILPKNSHEKANRIILQDLCLYMSPTGFFQFIDFTSFCLYVRCNLIQSSSQSKMILTTAKKSFTLGNWLSPTNERTKKNCMKRE